MRLITLGRLALVVPAGADDEALNKRRRKLALLAVLALARRPLPRDVLLEMFWGDQDEARARHSLSDALSHLRRVLGRDAITLHAADVALEDGAGLEVDAIEFAEAAADKDYERAAAFYGGSFLHGVYIAGSSSFEQWVTRERTRLETLFLQVCDRQCMALARARRWDDCGTLAARWLDAAPLSTDAALFRLNALKSPGTRDADQRALAEYERIATRLQREYDLAPDKAVVALARDIAARLAESGAAASLVTTAPAAPEDPASHAPPPAPVAAMVAAPGGGVPAEAGTPPAPPTPPDGAPMLDGAPFAARPALPQLPLPASSAEFRALSTAEFRALRASLGAKRPPKPRASSLRWWMAAAVMVVVLAGAAVLAPRLRQSGVAVATRPLVAIADIQTLRGDTSRSWMAEGLSQMIGAKLSRSSAVEVVPAERVRDVKARARLGRHAELTDEQLLDLGRRLGATWVVSGGLTGSDTALVFVLTVHDVRTGKKLEPDAVTGRNILGVADAAASRLLEAAGGSAGGPRLADVETESIEAAEHFARGMEAFNGGFAQVAAREMDAAIALDSGFVSAIRVRAELARWADDSVLLQRLDRLFEANRHRATEFDVAYHRLRDEWLGGDAERALSLARDFVRRFPRDPRSYSTLAEFLIARGRWDEGERVLEQEIALDSLALEAGTGACAMCDAMSKLVEVRWMRGDFAGAEQAARRWLALQPEMPTAWNLLSGVLGMRGQYEAAAEASRRSQALSGGEMGFYIQYGRVMLMKRDYAFADSVARRLIAQRDPMWRSAGYDLRIVAAREQGRMREANRITDEFERAFPGSNLGTLMRGNSLGRLGEYAAAAQLYERVSHDRPMSAYKLPLSPGHARAQSWHHALLADAIAPSGDTAKLKALADSLVLFAAGSYYGRDLRLHHHVRGLIHARAGRLDDAEREFRAAMWGVAGWTRTNVELAKVLMAQKRDREALDMLRLAYAAPLDAMGRYQLRSEVDLFMSVVFRKLGQTDSAAIYDSYVRRAWRDADPEIARELSLLLQP